MNAITSGVDLVEIDRFRNLNPKIWKRFIERVFTSAEIQEADEAFHHLAGKFAAKEAAVKALGCGIGTIGWQDLEILKDDQGKPNLILVQRARQIAEINGWLSWSVSITHTQTHAMAMVVALIEVRS